MKYLYTLALLFTFSLAHCQTYVQDFSSIEELVSIEDQVFFVANDGIHGNEVWTSDGSKEHTFLIKDINTFSSSNPASLVVFNNSVYFSADDGLFGPELWKTNGTEQGTVMVKNIHTSFGAGSYPHNFTIYNNELYFFASDYYSGSHQIWKTDGTDGGTIKVYDSGGNTMSHLMAANNKLYFRLNYGPNKLMAYDVNTGVNEIATDTFYSIKILNSFNDDLYYITNTSNNQDIRIYKLGDNGVSVLLIEFNEPPFSDYDVYNFTQVGSDIYFSLTLDLDSGEQTDQLWKTDGTSSGTVLVKTFEWDRYLSNSNISNFIEYQGQLFFNGGSQNNYHIWKSDGTQIGTVLSASRSVDRSIKFTKLNDLLYFSSSQKLYSTDGTEANTEKFSDVTLTVQYSDDLFALRAANNKLFFEAEYQNSKALFTTDLNPLIEVEIGNSIVLNSASLFFDSKIDSIAKKLISIKNIGNKDLTFSSIKVVGEDFYIKGQLPLNVTPQTPEGNFPQILEPGRQSKFEVSFFPSAAGMKTGTLRILSNDIKTPTFELDLVAMAEDEVGITTPEDISLIKEIEFGVTNGSISIDSNIVQENAVVNTNVGLLSIPGSTEQFTYELIADIGATDNQYFIVENNELKTNTVFNYEVKNTYNLMIKAINIYTNEVIEDVVIVSIIDVTEPPVLGDCSIDTKNLAFGLNDIEFINGVQAIAVGSHGVILKTDNAGTTWRKVRSDSQNNLYDVQFTTSSIGYAIGEAILKTEDGGENWFTLKLPSEYYPDPTKLYFFDLNLGFVFGQGGKLFKTTNGGRYWKQKTVTYENLNSMFFLNASTGFMVGDSESFYKTEDAGDSWQSMDISIEGLYYSTHFTNIYFLNDTLGYISTSRGDIIQTTDGGDTWALLSELEYNNSIKRLFFQDESIGYALTEEFLYKTLDGGQTWNRENLDYLYSGIQGVGFNADASNALLVGHGTGCCSGYSTGHIIYSKELDNDWENNSYLTLGSYDLTSVVYTEDLKIVFGDNVAARSYNNSEIWTRLTPPEDDIFQVELFNSSIYVLGRYNFYKSDDQGDTWINLGATTYFNKFLILNEQNFIAISYGLGIFKSTDGGLTWSNVSSMPSNCLDVYFKNENEGYVASVNTGIYRTLDAGITWSQVPMETDGGPMSTYSVHVYNDLGFAGSSSGLLKTTDGGATWQRAYKNLGSYVKHIHAINDQEWYAVTETKVFKSIDAGENWSQVYSSSYDIYGTYFIEDRVYLVGFKTFIEVGPSDAPNVTSPIEGDLYVISSDTSEYSVIDILDTDYVWSVTGDNNITYSGNRAEILWNNAGIYQVTVTPLNNCGNGLIREITVEVEEDEYSPLITGDEEVDAFSTNIEYSATFDANVRYNWSLNGAQNFDANSNLVNVEWGEAGVGKVHVITTNEIFGTRKEAFLDVTINQTSISTDNFDIEIIGESCPGSNNGQIIISALEEHDYQVLFNNTTFNFTNNLIIDGLAPNNYEFCITVPSMPYEQCYVLEVLEAEAMSGRYSLNSDRVSIDIDKGTAPFKVLVNEDIVLETSSTSFSINVAHGDTIEVKTDKPCEGSILKTIDLYTEVALYPNPTNGVFQIAIPLSLESITVEIYSSQLKLISNHNYNVIDGNLNLNVKDQPDGLYFVKLNLDKPLIFKLLKL